MKKFLVALSSLILLSSCEVVEFKDGRIPAAMLNEAKKLEGVYSGRFDGQAARLTLSFDQDRPVLTYVDARGNDLLGPACGSKIGLILKATVSNNELTSVTFAFDPGQCKVDGRELQLFLYEKAHKVGARLMDYEYIDRECTIDVPPPPAPPVQRCRTVIRQKYLEGSFIR